MNAESEFCFTLDTISRAQTAASEKHSSEF